MLRSRPVMILAVLVLILAAVVNTTTAVVNAQTPPLSDPSTWRFIASENDLYIITGSKEFVTKVDTANLPVKYFVHPQADGAGNIYLISVSSNDPDKSNPNSERSLSLYYTSTVSGVTAWNELTAAELGLNEVTGGIHDFIKSSVNDAIFINTKNGNIVVGNPTSRIFRLEKTTMAPEVTLRGTPDSVYGPSPSKGEEIYNLVSHRFEGNQISKHISRVSYCEAVGGGMYYFTPPRYLGSDIPATLTYRPYLPSYADTITIPVPGRVIAVHNLGTDRRYMLAVTQEKVLLLTRTQDIKSPVSQITDVTAKFSVKGKIFASIGDKNEFYLATDSGVIRVDGDSVDNLTVKTLRINAPTYAIAKVGANTQPAPATTVDPKEIVPSQPQGVAVGTEAVKPQPGLADTQNESEQPGSQPDKFPLILVVLTFVVLGGSVLFVGFMIKRKHAVHGHTESTVSMRGQKPL